MTKRQELRDRGGQMRHFVSPKIEVERSIGLDQLHAAVLEGRTLFPSRVISAAESPRLFVSGRNNPKLGGHVAKGPRTGWPIYHLALEERATCPASCSVWAECYGNTTFRSRRHAVDDALIPAMQAELRFLAAEHPDGFLIRLHSLGDFYSVEYLQAWADLLDEIPQLHVFGFTARREDADDSESRRIAKGIAWLSREAWDRFAIRFSRPEPGPQGSAVVKADPGVKGQVVCPAQTGGTDCCGTCGLCWARGFQQGTILFLLHGMKKNPPRYNAKT